MIHTNLCFKAKWCALVMRQKSLLKEVVGSLGNRPLSQCGHLDFTPFQLTVTKLRLDQIIVWCLVCVMNVSILFFNWKRWTWPQWCQRDQGLWVQVMEEFALSCVGWTMWQSEVVEVCKSWWATSRVTWPCRAKFHRPAKHKNLLSMKFIPW